MNKPLRIFFLLLFLCINCFAQNESNDKRIEDGLPDFILQTRNKMNENNIKDYFILSYSYYDVVSNESIEAIKTGSNIIKNFVAYIFWKNNKLATTKLYQTCQKIIKEKSKELYQ